MEKSIELDCAPGTPRPDMFIGGVLKDTGIEPGEPVSKSFGNWKWKFDHIADEVWKKYQPIFKKRITKLYNQGYIRYGSW